MNSPAKLKLSLGTFGPGQRITVGSDKFSPLANVERPDLYRGFVPSQVRLSVSDPSGETDLPAMAGLLEMPNAATVSSDGLQYERLEIFKLGFTLHGVAGSREVRMDDTFCFTVVNNSGRMLIIRAEVSGVLVGAHTEFSGLLEAARRALSKMHFLFSRGFKRLGQKTRRNAT